jgi:multiple sugar transport system permease protein
MKRSTRITLVAVCFLLPNFLGFCTFTLGPVLFSLGASFTNWTLVRDVPLQWIWFDNFTKLFDTPDFWLYFINTVYLMLGMPVAIGGSLFFAILLSQKLRGVVVYRTLFYLPSFTAGVALFILWKKLYNPEFGPVNQLIELAATPLDGLVCLYLDWRDGGVAIPVLRSVGVFPILEGPGWLSSTSNLLGLGVERVEIVSHQFGLGARDAIIIMGIWTAVGGGNMLLYLAGISNIPQDLYDAADIDGAGRWARFRHVTWPQLAPTTFFIVIMSFIGGLQGGFEQARVMTLGGPAGTTTTLSYYIYTKAFEEFQIGYASSIAWILFVMIFAVTLVNWRFGSRYVNY